MKIKYSNSVIEKHMTDKYINNNILVRLSRTCKDENDPDMVMEAYGMLASGGMPLEEATKNMNRILKSANAARRMSVDIILMDSSAETSVLCSCFDSWLIDELCICIRDIQSSISILSSPVSMYDRYTKIKHTHGLLVKAIRGIKLKESESVNYFSIVKCRRDMGSIHS